ncbi:sensor domain-containing diguanylate cyclase [Pseudomonas sp. BJa5]|uniref:sensor domain-containing diguanylate cyclase n=1 Tax=Pseudomonas sp. BJa5 TaxID=2936270 RepID=UPI00255A0922|nr:sensor domain-containing diguanylate cyclase [Pseudomonas sp. BGr12]MDL2423860.1 sensor domain-containing diguanylate cyclase [Pseudomonas sp. BGr12]
MSAISKVPSLTLEHDQLQTLLDLISDGIWDWNANTGYVYRNPGWYRMLGYASHSLDNSVHTWENIIHPEDYPRVMAHFEAYVSSRSEQYRVEYRCRCQDGSYLWVEDRGHILARNPDGTVARMLGAHRNIDAGKRMVEQLMQQKLSLESLVGERTRELSWVNQQLQRQLDENRDLAERDALTQVANRYRLEKVLQLECERAQRFRHPLALLVMDVDDFKPINERYGHARGDAALIEVAERIKGCLQEEQLLARWGGDEFVVVMPHEQLARARALAERIAQALAQASPLGDSRLTLSFGLVQWQDGEGQAQLLNRAEQALYRAKQAGKAKICE